MPKITLDPGPNLGDLDAQEGLAERFSRVVIDEFDESTGLARHDTGAEGDGLEDEEVGVSGYRGRSTSRGDYDFDEDESDSSAMGTSEMDGREDSENDGYEGAREDDSEFKKMFNERSKLKPNLFARDADETPEHTPPFAPEHQVSKKGHKKFKRRRDLFGPKEDSDGSEDENEDAPPEHEAAVYKLEVEIGMLHVDYAMGYGHHEQPWTVTFEGTKPIDASGMDDDPAIVVRGLNMSHRGYWGGDIKRDDAFKEAFRSGSVCLRVGKEQE